MSREENIVWITLDSVREDHTSIEGGLADTTPNMRRIAEKPRGRNFQNCFSHGRYTLTSTASMLSGVYPSRHQVGYGQQAISESIPTIAQLFTDIGYFTAGLSVNSFISPATGLDRGFKRFTYLQPSTLIQQAGIKNVAKFLMRIRRHSAGLQLDLRKHCTARLMTDMAKDCLNSFKASKEPFFLYIHYVEPHRPYYPPLSYIDAFSDRLEMSTERAAEFAMEIHDNFEETIANGCNFTEDQWEALKAMYDAEILYSDECVGELFDTVTGDDFGDTTFVITADHGELFGEQDMLGHKYVLDDAILRVPLVTYGLEDVDSNGLVQHSDVLATLLNRAGADSTTVQGVDLRDETRNHVIAQDHALTLEPIVEMNENFDTSRFYTTKRSVIRDYEYKLLLTPDETELYELPDEETDVSAKHEDVAGKLESKLREWLETQGQPQTESEEAKFTDEMKEHLSDLGYLESDFS